MYIKGKTNLVADTLSRYYESDQWDEQQNTAQYINVDSRLDPKGEDLPWDRFEEYHTMTTLGNDLCNDRRPIRNRHPPKRLDEIVPFVPRCKIIEEIETCQNEVATLAAHNKSNLHTEMEEQAQSNTTSNPRVIDSFNDHPNLRPHFEGDQSFLKSVQNGYKNDSLFKKVLKLPGHYKNFALDDNLLYTENLTKDRILCILVTVHNK